MRLANSERGKQHVHTIACYDNTWSKFQTMKNRHHDTADQIVNLLIDSYNRNENPKRYEKDILDSVIKHLQKRVNSLRLPDLNKPKK